MHVLIYPAPHPITEEVIASTVQRQIKNWRAEKDYVTWLKVVNETGKVVAGARWIVHPKPASETDSEKGKRWPDKVDVTWIEDGLIERIPSGNAGKGVDDKLYVEWVMDQLFGRRREGVQGPAVLLDICYTSPTHHRLGAGKQLVQWGTAKADELGVKAFVEASYTGRRLYESCGFEVKEHVLLKGGEAKSEWKDYGELGYYWMEREAKAKH